MVRINLSILLFTEVFLRLSLGIGSLQPNAAPFDLSQLEYTSEPTTLVVNGEHMLDGAAFHARYPISRKADVSYPGGTSYISFCISLECTLLIYVERASSIHRIRHTYMVCSTC